MKDALLSSLLPLIVLLAGPSVSQEFNCAESETLYEIEGVFSDDAVSIYVASDHDSYRYKDGDLFESSFRKYSNSWKGCLTTDQCYMVEIRGSTGTNPSQIAIRLHVNKKWEVVRTHRFTFPYIVSSMKVTYVELGSCFPECEDDESLFELDFFIGDRSRINWNVVESLGEGNAVVECDPYEGFYYDRCVLNTISGRNRFYRIRHCLQKDACYRFVASDEHYSVYKEVLIEKSAFNLTVDGNAVASREGFRFESIEFGDGCDNVVSDIYHCNEAIELLFEIFLTRDNFGWDYPPLSVKVTDPTQEREMLLDLNDWIKEDDFAYYHTCLPKNSCMNLTISVPETYTQTSLIDGRSFNYTEYGEIRAVLDGVAFHDSNYWLGEQLEGAYAFSYSFVLGDSCKNDDICNQKSESLFDITLSVPVDESKHYQDFPWSVVYYDHEVYRERGGLKISGSRHFDGYIAGGTYRTFACIPNDFCTEFSTYDFQTPRNVNYSILVNGEKREESYVEEQNFGGSPYINTILGGNNCPSKLSNGGIAGIVVASMVILAALLCAIWKFWCKRSSGNSGPLGSPDKGQETAIATGVPIAAKGNESIMSAKKENKGEAGDEA